MYLKRRNLNVRNKYQKMEYGSACTSLFFSTINENNRSPTDQLHAHLILLIKSSRHTKPKRTKKRE